jgi:hypothetical protein
MIPNPKIDALLNAPPKKVSNNPKIPPALSINFDESIPGSVMNEPNLKTIRKPRVFKILVLSSSIEKMFAIVLKNLFI